MTDARALVRTLVVSAGYDLPAEPWLPPMDAAGQTAAAVAIALSDFAAALGMATDPAVSRDLFERPRSLASIRAALVQLHLALAFASLELGLEDLSAGPAGGEARVPFGRLLRRVRTINPKVT